MDLQNEKGKEGDLVFLISNVLELTNCLCPHLWDLTAPWLQLWQEGPVPWKAGTHTWKELLHWSWCRALGIHHQRRIEDIEKANESGFPWPEKEDPVFLLRGSSMNNLWNKLRLKFHLFYFLWAPPSLGVWNACVSTRWQQLLHSKVVRSNGKTWVEHEHSAS